MLTNKQAIEYIDSILSKYNDPKEVDKLDPGYRLCEVWLSRYDLEALKMSIQALEQEPRKGHWIPVFQGDEIIDYRCSCCEFGNTFGKGTVGMNYCPRCGSRNEVEK